MPCARLLHEHMKLRALGAELVEFVSGPTPCDLALLADKRWELARMIHQHLAYEDRQLFQPLIADPNPEVSAKAQEGKRGIEHLHMRYKEHVEHWTADHVCAHWPQFQAAVRSLVTRMTLKLDREEQMLFPLVGENPVILPRGQPGARNWAGDGVALQPLIRSVGVTR